MVNFLDYQQYISQFPVRRLRHQLLNYFVFTIMAQINQLTYDGNDDASLIVNYFMKTMAITKTDFNLFQYPYCISHG